MTEWTFFTYSDPKEVKEQQARKKIRGHVTRRQHALNRSRQPANGKSMPPGSLVLQSRSDTASSSGSASTASSASPPKVALPRRHVSAFRVKPQARPQTSEQRALRRKARTWDVVSSSDEEAMALASSRGSTPDYLKYPAVSISSPTNSVDLNIAPVPPKEWYGWLHDYWFNGTLPRAKPRLKVNEEQLQRYISWTRSLVVTEPAFYYMSLLLATGIPVSNGQFPFLKALWLRGRTVAAINEALSDPERMTSDALIQAVGQIALHEHIYGDRAAAHQIHRPAQQRMIDMRGGLSALNLPPEVKQIMVWYDKLMAAEAGNQPYFSGFVDGQSVKEYTDTEAVSITNSASPYRNRHPGYRTGEVEPELDD